MRQRWFAVAVAGLLVLTACSGGSKHATGVAGSGIALPVDTTTTAPTTTAPPTTTTIAPLITTTSTRLAALPTTTAVRVTTPAAPACAANLAGRLASTGGASQLITVDAPVASSTTATVAAWQRSGNCWVLIAGPWTGRTGRNGLSAHHVEGDGTTPMGGYGIGPVMYGIGANPGVQYQYHHLVCGDWWDEDPASPAYNTFQAVGCGVTPPFHGNSEPFWMQTVAYQHLAVINYNTEPIVPGAGSGIFLHDDTGGPTDGCVSLPAPQLDTLLRWLNPAAAPLIVMGTDDSIARY